MGRGGSSAETEATAACQEATAAWCKSPGRLTHPSPEVTEGHDSLKNGSRPITKPLALWTPVALVLMVLEQQCQHWEPLLALWTSVALLAMVLGEQYQH